MKTKYKNDAPHLNTTLFLMLWIGAHALAWATNMAYSDWMATSPPHWIMYLPRAVILGMYGLSFALIIVPTQKILLSLGLGLRINWWMRLSFIGWIVGGYLMMYLTLNMVVTSKTIAAMLLFFPATIMQFLLLRRFVSGSWLWLLAGIVSSAVFALPIDAQSSSLFSEYIFAALAGSLQGAVTGLSLLWLFNTSRAESRKAK